MAKCRSCGKPIGFQRTKDGKLMPVEPGVKTVLDRDGFLHTGYEPHWMSCPHANQHRPQQPERNRLAAKPLGKERENG